VWLVLCDDLDASAQWVYEGLRERAMPVELVTSSVLSRAVRWVHRVDSEGASVEVLLSDGRRIVSNAVRGTLNRMVGPCLPPAYFSSPDGVYARTELLAMYVSLLRALPPPVLNRPGPQGLSGRMRYTPEWLVLAARAGFATQPYTVSSRPAGRNHREVADDLVALPGASRHQVIVAAGRAFGHQLSTGTAAAACQLASVADTELLGLRLAITDDGAAWFEAADLYPDLRTAGADLLDHLARAVAKEAPA
jgi:hypothetical protein